MRTTGTPVVDLEDAHGLVEALSAVGFVAVRGHGVPDADLNHRIRAMAKTFWLNQKAFQIQESLDHGERIEKFENALAQLSITIYDVKGFSVEFGDVWLAND